MGIGRNIEATSILGELKSLDIDEGIRLESRHENKKIFINKNVTGTFTVQVTDFKGNPVMDNDGISYCSSPREVMRLARRNFKGGFSSWLY